MLKSVTFRVTGFLYTSLPPWGGAHREKTYQGYVFRWDLQNAVKGKTEMEKAEIRKQNKMKRAEMSKADARENSSVISELFLNSELYKNAKCIMLYMPLGNEVDTKDITKAAFKDGKKVVLPVTDNKNNIIPYFVKKDTEFQTGAFSVKEPIGTEKANTKEIDLVIVPGIAFDKSGNRIGFGKGCYDGFLKNINAVKVGICYEFQMCDEISADLFDVKMDYVITEKGIFLTSSQGKGKVSR